MTSTDCYDLSVSDPLNNGYLKSATDAFTTHLQWRVGGTGPFTDLLAQPATVASNEGVTLGRNYAIAYQQPLASQNVPTGAYSTTATFTASTSSC